MGILGVLIDNFKNMKRAKKYRAMGKVALLALDDESFYDAMQCVCEDNVYDFKNQELPIEQRLFYSLLRFVAEVNNGGLCQFFVNSSRECAPYISKSLEAVGAAELKAAFDSFIIENGIDINDLSSFAISSIDEYESRTVMYNFDSFDDKFYDNDCLYEKMILFARENIDDLLK